MEVITIESGLWQQLLNRIERIETYVKEAGKITYRRYAKQLRYRLSDIEEFAHVTMRPLSKKLLASIRQECIDEKKRILENMED